MRATWWLFDNDVLMVTHSPTLTPPTLASILTLYIFTWADRPTHPETSHGARPIIRPRPAARANPASPSRRPRSHPCLQRWRRPRGPHPRHPRHRHHLLQHGPQPRRNRLSLPHP